MNVCSVHPLDCNEILDIFKDKKHQLLYIKSIIMLPIVAVEAIMTSNFWGEIPVPTLLCMKHSNFTNIPASRL